jgi:hypothetical protein
MIRSFLMSIPGPTDNWAAIVGHLAWPVFGLISIWLFRDILNKVGEILADRLRHSNIRVGQLEITSNAEVVNLDKSAVELGQEPYAPDDIDKIERLFEFIAEEGGFVALSKWVADNMGPAMDIDNFLTLPDYASDRAAACEALRLKEHP